MASPAASSGHHHEDEESASTKAILIAYGSMAFPMTMQASVELGLLDIISKKEKHGGPVTAAEIVSELSIENPMAAEMVKRMLYLLAAFSIVSCSVESGKGKVFGMKPVGKYFVKDENEGMSLGSSMSLTQGEVYMKSWSQLKDAVLEGGSPFYKAHATTIFEYTARDPKFSEVFNVSMFNLSSMAMREILKSYIGFESVNQIVDVGGGIGHNLKMILSKYSHIKGINFDLPHVISQGLSNAGLCMKHVGGDMLESVPYADAFFLKWILHDWDDKHCIKLLQNCHKALPQNGKVIAVEGVLEDEFKASTITTALCGMDLIMLTQCPGGKERTKKEFTILSQAAGFTQITFETYAFGFWVIEFHKSYYWIY